MLVSKKSGSDGSFMGQSAHVVVCGNEKGGSGKSTLSMHVIAGLLRSGFKVASIDLDSRQKTLTRYVENRRRWATETGRKLGLPHHYAVERAYGDSVSDIENEEYKRLADHLASVQHSHDFVVIDTPGSDTFLQRLAHLVADTLITPINDSFVDFDVLAKVDPISYEILEVSQYASAVRDARRERRQVDNKILDWVVVRNRLSSITSRNEAKVETCLRTLAMKLGFRTADGISERVVFREFFPIGLTAIDDFDTHVLGTKPTLSHLAARQEIRQLISTLRLPVDELNRKRAETRQAWLESSSRPLKMPNIFAH
jgi:chromosome partitioning protein